MDTTIKEIPATKNINTHESLEQKKKRRVAAYIRVSTLKEEQQKSFERQKEYYAEMIKNNPAWEYAGIFCDEGVSGTKASNRAGFSYLMEKTLNGDIDLIITKSVTRFARNTMESIDSIRRLKECGVEVYFENDNIWTLNAEGEFIITVIAALAQEESRSISENTKWGMRNNMKNGKGCLCFSSFLGYESADDGRFAVNESEAKIVRRIYEEYVYGYSMYEIGKRLEADNILTATGREKWYISSIKSILTNEKYKGDNLMQKTYTRDHISKKVFRNTGELPQYYVANHHEPIVSRELWEAAQTEITYRNQYARISAKDGYFRGLVVCEACKKKCSKMCYIKSAHKSEKGRNVYYWTGKKCGPTYSENILVLAIYDLMKRIYETECTSSCELGNNGGLIFDDDGKLSRITIRGMHKLIVRIVFLQGNRIRFYFRGGKQKEIDIRPYKKDERLRCAYRFVKNV